MKSVTAPLQCVIHTLLLTSLSLLTSPSPSLAAEESNSNPKYLETRNDLGIVAYCSKNGLLAPDSEIFFKAYMDFIFGELPASAEGDLHEKKGREGISYLKGEEQPVEELAAANAVDLPEVCNQYRHMILGGKLSTKK